MGLNCEVDSDCDDPGHSRCNVDKICGCQPDHSVENNATCEPLLHGFCKNNERCKFENSECIDNMCKCKSGFIALTPTKCVKCKYTPIKHTILIQENYCLSPYVILL